MSRLAWTRIGLLCAALLAGCQPAPSVIKIGVSQPMSGPLGALGQDMVNGAQLAIDDINAEGGVRIDQARVKLELVAVDDKADAATGKAAAEQLVQAGVTVALAHLNSGVSIAAAPVYAAAGIPQLAISTKPAYTKLGFATTLRLVANDDLQSKAMGEYAASLAGAERFAVLDDSTPYGKGLADDAARVLETRGKAVAVRRSFDDKTTDFAALVGELGKSKIDVVVTTLNDFQVEALIVLASQQGLSKLRVLGGDTIKTDRLNKVGGMIQGLYATSGVIEAREFQNGKRFLTRFRERYKGDPVYGAHYHYDAVHVVADALTRNASVDKAALLKRLKNFDGYAPVTGTMRFRGDGEQRYGAVAVYQWRAGQWNPLVRSDQW